MTDSILLITVDCLRPDHVSGYGYHRETTPNIDELAQRGTVFTDAYSNGPGTRFGFKAIHAGVHPLRIKGTGLPRRSGRTLAEVLRNRGYQTAGFSDNPFVSTYFNYHRGFEEFTDYASWTNNDEGILNLRGLNRLIRQRIGPAIPEGRAYDLLRFGYDSLVKFTEGQGANVNSNDENVVAHALDWISEAEQREDPYFCWVHLMDAHHPYSYFPEHRAALEISSDSDHVRMPSVTPGTPPSQPLIDSYDTNLRNADSHVGRLLENVDDGVGVILTADHGEEFGLHNRFHKESVYQSIARIPLVVNFDGFETQRRHDLASLIDIAPTIAQLAGADRPDHWDGQNLQTRTENNEVFLGFENEDGVSSAVVSDSWKYICHQDSLEATPSSESLYNIGEDPEEQREELDENRPLVEEFRDIWESYRTEILNGRYKAERELWDSNKSLTETVGSTKDMSKQDIEMIDDRLEHLGYK